MQLSHVFAALSVTVCAALLGGASADSPIPWIPVTNHIFLGNGLVQSGIGIGVQIGSGLATLAAAALAARKWKIENTQPVIYKQPVVTKQQPTPLRPVQAIKIDELSAKDLSNGLGDLGASLGAVAAGTGSGLTESSSGSLAKSLSATLTSQLQGANPLGRRRRSAEEAEYFYIY